MATTVANWKTLRPRVTKRLLNEIVRRIIERFQPEKIILFGSYAYGKPTLNSDVDLLVIMDSDLRPAQRSAAVYPVAAVNAFLPMDILVRTPAEIEQRLQMGDFFIAEILEKGKVLYGRSG